jgi:hypothetical protein
MKIEKSSVKQRNFIKGLQRRSKEMNFVEERYR